MPWFCAELGDALAADAAVDRIRALGRAAQRRAGDAADIAIFVRQESGGRLHCEVVVYFSPAATQVAEMVGATPCNQPALDGLTLLAGTEQSWTLWFGG